MLLVRLIFQIILKQKYTKRLTAEFHGIQFQTISGFNTPVYILPMKTQDIYTEARALPRCIRIELQTADKHGTIIPSSQQKYTSSSLLMRQPASQYQETGCIQPITEVQTGHLPL